MKHANKTLLFASGGFVTVILVGIYEFIFYMLIDYLGLISMFFIWLPVFPFFILQKILPLNIYAIMILAAIMWFFVGGWAATKRFVR